MKRVVLMQSLPPRELLQWYSFKFPFNPEAPGKHVWDFLIMVLLVFTCFAVPFQLAFTVTPGNILTPYNAFDVFVDSCFMSDVVVNFFTAYYDEGHYIDDFTKIKVHYLKTWFLLDVAGSFPFDKVRGFC